MTNRNNTSEIRNKISEIEQKEKKYTIQLAIGYLLKIVIMPDFHRGIVLETDKWKNIEVNRSLTSQHMPIPYNRTSHW